MNINHVGMYVTDIEKTKEFFEKYFGAKSSDGFVNKDTGFRSYILALTEAQI